MQMNRLEQCWAKSIVSLIFVILFVILQVTDTIMFKQISYFSTAGVYLF